MNNAKCQCLILVSLKCPGTDCDASLPGPADPNNYQVIDYRSGEFTRSLMVSTRAGLTQEQLFALFDLIPGMEYCELQRDAYGIGKGWRVHVAYGR